MEEAGGGRCKTGDDGLAHCAPCTTIEGIGVTAIDIEPNGTSWHRPVEAAAGSIESGLGTRKHGEGRKGHWLSGKRGGRPRLHPRYRQGRPRRRAHQGG